jgi:dCTP deaminase
LGEDDHQIKNVRPQGAVLTKDALRYRLFTKRDIVISPILDPSRQIGEGSVDISLGPRFIVNQRPQVNEIDPMTLTNKEIRKFQQEIVVPFGEKFTLHPQSFLLGGTFEFVALPADVCGFVLSRSSYGRAGLLVATATFVHPGWHGCLTLELENLGEVPIALRPGSPVGQLVFVTADPPVKVPPFKTIPVGPTFTSLAEDPRWKRLQQLKSS